MAAVGQEHGVVGEPAHNGAGGGELPLGGGGAHFGVRDGLAVGLDVDGAGRVAVQRIVAVEHPPVRCCGSVLGACGGQAAGDGGRGEQAPRPFEDGDVLAAVHDQSGRYLPALPGEFGVDAQAQARLGQDAQQRLAQGERPGEVGLDVGLVLRGRGAVVGAHRDGVVAEAGCEAGGGAGGPLQDQPVPAGQAPVAAPRAAVGEPGAGVGVATQVDDPPAVDGVDGELAHARQLAARAAPGGGGQDERVGRGTGRDGGAGRAGGGGAGGGAGHAGLLQGRGKRAGR
ncbi:hypothetical protein AB0D42_37490 [Streptomyces sp. NPDC048304]|uniref:hypothetical protein n=1 Tax=Streptomyces sp. NPDC048304 TaxID=3154820 RepID=UPI0033F3BD26